MNIGFSNVNRITLPQTAGVGEATSRRLSGDAEGQVQAAGRRFPEELAQVSGEERVDEAALRRDDDLGKLLQKAFDPKTASAALPPLCINEIAVNGRTPM